MRYVNIHEAKTHFSKLINEVLNGKEIIISKGNKPVAKLVSLEGKSAERKIGTAKGMVYISPDFDKPLDDFREYTE